MVLLRAGAAGAGPDGAGADAAAAVAGIPSRHATARTYLMCPPDYFTVEYAINPWMDPGGAPVDRALARRQWERLVQVYRDLGHTVRLIEPEPGLPDMVFAANGATVIGGRVLGARFRYPERAAEGKAYLDWFRRSGYPTVRDPDVINEGEGDLLYTGRAVIAGHGFRTDAAAADELEELFGLPVVSVRLTDPRFYHLDTALAVLDGDTAAYYPAAFTAEGRAALAGQFGTLIEASERDAVSLGLNAVSDGRHVVLPAEATGLAGQLTDAGFEPVPLEFSEFRKAGGGPKCCTLVLRG
jgi:N-dimethylarginine dimethylaminohydrolase